MGNRTERYSIVILCKIPTNNKYAKYCVYILIDSTNCISLSRKIRFSIKRPIIIKTNWYEMHAAFRPLNLIRTSIRGEAEDPTMMNVLPIKFRYYYLDGSRVEPERCKDIHMLACPLYVCIHISSP